MECEPFLVPELNDNDIFLEKIMNDASVEDTNSEEMVHLQDLLTKIFVYDPAERITPEQALQHPFLQNYAVEAESLVTIDPAMKLSIEAELSRHKNRESCIKKKYFNGPNCKFCGIKMHKNHHHQFG